MRARFVDADATSFFDEIDGNAREIYLRALPCEISFEVDQPRDVLRIKREIYRREVWFVPVGPIACPIGEPGEQLDAIYKFECAD